MAASDVRYHEVISVDDPLLPDWLALYETAFPANERVLCATWLRILSAKGAGEQQDQHLLAAVCEGQLAGLASYATRPDVGAAHLQYLATVPELRSQGIGAALYGEVVRRVRADCPSARGMVIEVESPREVSTEDPEMALRRIGFYKRQGARVLSGIEYWQSVPGHRAIRMCLMVHAFGEMSPAEGLELAQAVLGDVQCLSLAWE